MLPVTGTENVHAEGCVELSDPLHRPHAAIERIASRVVGDGVHGIQGDGAEWKVHLRKQSEQPRRAILDVVAMNTVPPEQTRDAKVGRARRPQIIPRHADHVDVIADQDPFLNGQILPAYREADIERPGVIIVEKGKQLSELALEEERLDLTVEIILPSVIDGGAKVVPNPSKLVGGPKADQHPLGSSEPEIGENIEPLCPLAVFGQPVVKGLHAAAISPEDPKRRSPYGAGGQPDSPTERAAVEQVFPELQQQAGTLWKIVRLQRYGITH